MAHDALLTVSADKSLMADKPNSAIKLMCRSTRRSILVVLLTGTAGLLLTDCTDRQPVRVGFAGQLTGIQAELGVQERNGVQLAVEEINAAGGIAGRPIELVVRDDLGTPEGAQVADRELINAGTVAIIGHTTSSQTLAGLAVTAPACIMMLSPTTSTPELTGKDDYFFRVVQPITVHAFNSAQHIRQGKKRARVAVIYDADNAAYSTAYLNAFSGEFQSLGGEVVAKAAFSSKTRPDFSPLIAQIRESKPDQLLIIAADIDTALIAQRVRLKDWQVPLFTTAWAQTETLINAGGRAVDDMELELISAVYEDDPSYKEFAKRYRAKFGRSPSFGAVMGHEAANVLAAGLRRTGAKADGMKQALIAIKEFKGLSEAFRLDEYGDVVRPVRLGVIRGGRFVRNGAVKPAKP